MKYDEFKALIESICPDSDGAAEVWQTWAKELERMDNPDHKIGDFKTVETFLGEFAELIQEVNDEYGNSVAQQIVRMALIPACLFPWEVKGAAEHFAQGGSVEEIPEMEEQGTLENMPEYLAWVKYRQGRSEEQSVVSDLDENVR